MLNEKNIPFSNKDFVIVDEMRDAEGLTENIKDEKKQIGWFLSINKKH